MYILFILRCRKPKKENVVVVVLYIYLDVYNHWGTFGLSFMMRDILSGYNRHIGYTPIKGIFKNLIQGQA